MLKLLISLLFISWSFPAFSNLQTNDRFWLGVFGSAPVARNYSFLAAGENRSLGTNLSQNVLLLTGGVVKTSERKVLYGAYYTYLKAGEITEHRGSLRTDYYFHLNPESVFYLKNRIDYIGRVDANHAVRLVETLRYARKINHTALDFVAWNELFLNLSHNEWTGSGLFDKNRIFAGLNIPTFAGGESELGYLYEYNPGPVYTLSKHVLVLYFFF